MSNIDAISRLLPDDRELILDEYAEFTRTRIRKGVKNRYYVYALTHPDGIPFYIGKGSGKRAWDHLLSYNRAPPSSTKMACIHDLIDNIKEYPIISIYSDGLSETDALAQEAFWISHFGRLVNDTGILTNIMLDGAVSDVPIISAQMAIGGAKGGRTTKDSRVGIFSPTYDRSAQSKKNWEMGLLDHINFRAAGHKAGTATRANASGIFDPAKQHLRSEWSSNAANALTAAGTRKGCCTVEWWLDPVNRQAAADRKKKRDAAAAETIRINGPKFIWSDGNVNIRSYVCPGGSFVRGTTRTVKSTNQKGI